MAGQIIALVIAALVVIAIFRAVRIVPQARAYVVERVGRYHKTLSAGLWVIVPFFDYVRTKIDLREQVVSFAPQPVITQDNLAVEIDTVVFYQVTDPKTATYEIADFVSAMEQLTVTTLRNVIGGMDLERTLTSREEVSSELRGVLDEATGKWGIRVNRVEIKAIDPPVSIRDSMEKQMRAERDKRAAVLSAEGHKQAQILSAEGERSAAVLKAQGDREAVVLRAEGEKEAVALRAEGERQAAILRAEGEGQAIDTVFGSIHEARADSEVLAYSYLQMLPQLSKGEGSTVWVIPGELTKALESLGQAFDTKSGPGRSESEGSGSNA